MRMNRKLSFGAHEGKTFEWLFFNAPWYADWMHKNNVLEGRWDYDEEDCACFRELHRRASALAGECLYCNERQIARKALSRSVSLDAARFCCNECKPLGGGLVIYQRPSFFLAPGPWTREAQKRLTVEIKEEYMGSGNLTQRKMEDFFQTDEWFSNATSNFFAETEVQQ
jgi:hypothetical protein